MEMGASDHLDDAQLLYDRAQTHRREFNARHGAGAGRLWDLRRSTSADGTAHTAELTLDRTILRELKPVIADIANNLVHALDHVAAAARVQADTGKTGRLYFPITDGDGAFAERIAQARLYIGDDWADLFTAAREQHRICLAYLKTVKTLSNEAKHWELRPGTAGAHAVQWFEPGHHIKQVPAGHFAANDSYRFWEAAESFPNVGIQIVASYKIRSEGVDEVDLDSVLQTSSIFVAGLIAKSREHLAAVAPAQP